MADSFLRARVHRIVENVDIYKVVTISKAISTEPISMHLFFKVFLYYLTLKVFNPFL